MPQIAHRLSARAAPKPLQSALQGDRWVYAAVLIMYAMLLPPQLNFTVLGATLSPYRLLIIIGSVYIFASGLNGRLKLVLPDYLVMIATGWLWISFYINLGFDEFAVPAGGQTADIALSYFFARAAFRNLRDLRLFLLLVAPGLAVIGGILVLESVSQQHILQPFFADLLGKSKTHWRTDYRLGIMRAAGSFPHSILAGIFFASFLPLYFLSGLKGWPRILGLAASLASFFTASSAALLALSLGGALVAYNWLTERIANLSWRVFFAAVGVFVFFAELGTESGSFNLIMRFGSLNSASAYNRVLIWRYGSENVQANPWFGIGYDDWVRPDWMVASIDHYWLLQAIQVGVIPPLMIALATIMGIVTLLRASAYLNWTDRQTMRGLAMAMSVFALGAVSVSIWLSAQVWFHMMIGICVSLGYNALASVRMRTPAKMQSTHRAAPAWVRHRPAPTQGMRDTPIGR